jgi:hypothetical protein
LEQDGKKVYFTAAVDGTKQLFCEFSWDDKNRNPCATGNQGDFDVNDLVGYQQQYYRKQRRYEPCFRDFSYDLRKILGNKSCMHLTIHWKQN